MYHSLSVTLGSFPSHEILEASMHLWLFLNRYFKRGVSERGRVANDVDIEQIVFADACDGSPMQTSSC
ncbi:hypothetical protein P8452_23191 [Trifolium repens]|nr:hypothetical protein P8452_23191 [Trifolium repens]